MGDECVTHGDCRAVLPTLPAESFDSVVCDPPYPCIDRSYGYWTEAEWFALMDAVVPECRRVLKPTGSAVFILQPNSERVGRMRTWLWEFMAKWGKEWGMVQDVWWWNTRALPEAHAIQGRLTRPSLKACAWFGSPDCWRDQDAVLWSESDGNKAVRLRKRFHNDTDASGHHRNQRTISAAAVERGGVTPFNVIMADHGYAQRSAGAHGHGAGTPMSLCRWWVRYICPPGGRVLDPFAGSGTTILAAEAEGRTAVGIEQSADYVAIVRKRLAEARERDGLFADMQSP